MLADSRLSPRVSALTAPHPRRMRCVVGASVAAAAFTIVVAGILVAPATAHAEIPIIGPAVKTIEVGAEALFNPVEALTKVLRAIFGGFEAKLITAIINGLLAVPNFDTGHVAEVEHTTVAIAAGMLGAVLTLSILRYYLAGLSDSSSGGFEAIQGLIRVVGAVGFIIAWPGIFSEALQIPKAFDEALLGSGTVQHSVALLFDAALVIGGEAFGLNKGLGLIFVILIAFVSAVVFVALLWMKVLLGMMMMFLYVSMPLCVVMWPVPELSWVAVAALRSLFVALLVPCVWAILFALSAAVNADVLTWAPSHSIIDTVIIRPLAGITLMLLCITIPRFLMRTAMIGPQGQANRGWRIWRMVTFGMFAMRGAGGVAKTVASAATEGHSTAQRMIDALPSQVSPPTAAGEGGLAGRIVFGRSGYPKRNSASESGGSSPAAGESQSGASDSQTREKGGAQDGTIKPAMRLPGVTPARYDRDRIDRAGEEMYDQAGAAPSSAEDVSKAMATLPPQTQRAIAEFRANDYQKLRDLIAHNLHSPSLSEDQHQALWTIGTARNREVKQGIETAIAALDQAAGASAPRATEGQAGGPQGSGDGAADGASSAPGGGAAAAPSSSPPAGGGASPIYGPSTSPSSAPSGSSGGPSSAGGAAAPPGTASSAPPAEPTNPPSEDSDAGRSLGSDLPQQPAMPDEEASVDDPPLPDIEPFLD